MVPVEDTVTLPLPAWSMPITLSVAASVRLMLPLALSMAEKLLTALPALVSVMPVLALTIRVATVMAVLWVMAPLVLVRVSAPVPLMALVTLIEVLWSMVNAVSSSTAPLPESAPLMVSEPLERVIVPALLTVP